MTTQGFKAFIGSALLLTVSGCGLLGSERQPASAFADYQVNSPRFESGTACARWLQAASALEDDSPASLPSSFVVAAWNAYKSTLPGWQDELADLAARADILLLQETAIVPAARQIIPQRFVSVSEGYYSRGGPTGLLSASHVAPLGSCTFVDTEPLLRSEKASSATVYALDSKKETLLVVNVHSINFSLGLGLYRQQLRRLAMVMAAHEGPIILAGDLNVWNARREDFVKALAAQLGLQEVEFTPDDRLRAFGYSLDRIYWRGLQLRDAAVLLTDSSDHNAMIANFSLGSEENNR